MVVACVMLFYFALLTTAVLANREEKCWQLKNWICGFYGICWLFRKAKPPCKNQLVGAYKHCYDPMTPWKSFQNRPGLYTLRSRSILEGFVCSHQIITVLISPHQFEPTGWFSAKGLFPSCSFFNMPTQRGKDYTTRTCIPWSFWTVVWDLFCPLWINKEGWRRKGQWLNSPVCMSTCKCVTF